MATSEELALGTVSGLERGTAVVLECLVPPVVNAKEGIWFCEVGERLAVVLSGFWEGLLERRLLKVVELAEPLPDDPQLPPPTGKRNNHRDNCKCPVCRRQEEKRLRLAAEVRG